MVLLLLACATSAQVRKFEIKGDTSSYTLNLALDNTGQPLYFFRNIFTEVCNTGECKPVRINFYWDLMGNYLRYDLPTGEVLTKTDHGEFKPDEYQRLQDILSRENSIFSELKMEDLVVKGTESISDSANIKTGATLKTIRNDVIEGAVYTCYTLWHLAHGQTSNEIKNITETYTSPKLLHSFLRSTNYHYQYWAMDRVMDSTGKVQPAYEEDIMNIIAGKNIFTARYALQEVNKAFLQSAKRQLWLWETYQSTVYPLQMAILKKLKEIPLTEALANRIAVTVRDGNRDQFRTKLALLAAQPSLPGKAQQQLAGYLKDEEVSEEIYAALQKLKPVSKTVQQQMADYASKK